MRISLEEMLSCDGHMGCFGNFNPRDSVCKTNCILSIRCAIEREHSARMEMLEEILSAEPVLGKLQ
jgi:hypothetical protein